MKRWSVRRALVGVVAITVSIAARHADAQVVQGAAAPVMVRVDDIVAQPNYRAAPRQWRPVQTTAMAWRNYLAGQRRTQIARLAAYSQAGMFPTNRVQPGRLNIFVDPSGRLCAVANLLSLSGHRPLVDRVAQSNNFVRFADLSTGPLVDWSLSSGLTREEIARIQEPYEGIPQGLPANIEWQAQQSERARLQSHFAQVLGELEANFEASVQIAVARLGAHVFEAPHDLGWDEPAPVQPAVQPYVQPVVYPQPYVQPVVYPQPYVQPVVVYPEPVLRPVRVNAYTQPVIYPTPQPVMVQPVVTQPIQVHVNVSVQANPAVTY
jgi:hypothetical protein